MEFIKMHGLGNDFIFLDQMSDSGEEGNANYSELAEKLCHRRFGIGGDGLVVILPSKVADARMRIFNSDGSEPEMCGNGIRCFARYLYDQGIVVSDSMLVETGAGILKPKLFIKDGQVQGVQVDMGEPVLKAELIPVLGEGEPVIGRSIEALGETYLYTAVSMGNPHCIIFVEDYATLDFDRVGPAIEKHSLFPRKTNVEFIQINSPQEITMKVWERGAGPTLACGTGACASVVASVLNHKTERKVTVHLPGGDLFIEWGADNHVYMTGPAAYAFKGEWLGL
ncbi:diaminopimelate epimerase [Desulfosporosinus orientis DSM 765]|uniref:Diaminopimelate epimerase n=1 Tax=Desulfosporosinus orientis (strain ATCC 19365 / DSM 765 / NCIMB 8382 / VKM B-1628 / Singapore I) TaxID=768706 RepID=G7WG68_DESOD|nr:diaminopimelate epimerase [Desulfosporosinus orientis]AET70162.1 diaminopimelate epimerase [Desulfosporosinus orientis DSM 765]